MATAARQLVDFAPSTASPAARLPQRFLSRDLSWLDLFGLDIALVLGPTAADEALRLLDLALPGNAAAISLLNRALLLAMLGRFDEAWPLAHEASARQGELTGTDSGDSLVAEVAMYAGDHEAAAGYLRTFCDWCEKHGQRGYLSVYAPVLGRELCALGRHDEAGPLAQLGREIGDEQDLTTQILWRQVKALVHASRSEHAQAEHLAREAVMVSEQTDSLNLQGDALCDLADVLQSASRTQEAAGTLEQALERYERKRNLAMAERVRVRLTDVRALPAAPDRA